MRKIKNHICKTQENHTEQTVRASFKDRVKKFDEYFNDPEQFNKIFTELGFIYVNDGCDGFCPECKQMKTCEVYKEIKDGWEEL